MLLRCLAAAGNGVGAARQVAICCELFQRELGVTPGPVLAEALHTATAATIADADATGDPVLQTRRRVGRSGRIALAVRHLPRYASSKSKVAVVGRQSRDGRCLRFLETMPSTMQGSQRCSNGVGSRPVP